MNNLLTFLNTIQPISIELGNAILSSTEREVLPRHHYLLRPGGVTRQVYFLETRVVLGYTLLHGHEISSWFMQAGNFAIFIVSFFTQQPSEEYLELLEPAVLHSIGYDQLQQLYRDFPEFNFIGRRLVENYFVRSEQRVQNLRSRTAAERYERLLVDFPTIFQQVAVQHIASHLGMAPETLSRLRRKQP